MLTGTYRERQSEALSDFTSVSIGALSTSLENMNLLNVESLKLNETKRMQYERPDSDERGAVLSVEKFFKIKIGAFWSGPILSVHGEIHLEQSAGQYLTNLVLTLSLAIYNPIYWEDCRNPVNEVTNIRTI